MGGVDRASLPRRSGDGGDPLQAHSGGDQPSDLARALALLLGRVAEALHQPEQARAEYETAARGSAAYYGQLARARLGLAALDLAPPPPKPDKQAEAERLELVRAVEILYALNGTPAGHRADGHHRRDAERPRHALGARRIGGAARGCARMLHLGKGALARGLPLDYYAFPTVGVPRYSPIAPSIESAMLYAVIRQESAFDPSDWSHAQAMGLMQVTPEAGRIPASASAAPMTSSACAATRRITCKSAPPRSPGCSRITAAIPSWHLPPTTPAAAGCRSGSQTTAIPRDPKVDPVDWVERIPFMETRNYVQRVMENLQVYRVRFGNEAPLAVDKDPRRDAAAR